MSETVDQSVLQKLYNDLGQDPTTIKTMISIYLREAPSLMGRIQAGLAKHEMKTVEMAAHSLKSSSAALGAPSISSLAKEIESASREGKEALANEKFAGMLAVFARVQQELAVWTPPG